MDFRSLAIAIMLAALSLSAEAADLDELARPFDAPDLAFPSQPRPLASGRESMMFKPDGAGPFPALVIMPTCYGHLYTVNTFDWAQRAVAHGYAALVVDPLAPRGIDDNCTRPLALPAGRILEDAFDAAEHLRKQDFVDPARVALLGFSQGAMIGLGASGSTYARLGGRASFRAVVSVYPICIYEKYPMPGMSQPVDIRYVPNQIVVPILVEIGDQDTRGGPAMNGCKTLLAERKERGDPVEFIIYHATHVWDNRELGATGERTTGVYGQEVLYQYNAEATEQSAEDAFAFLENQMKGP
jgi:dienelactone hydrolase